MPASPPTTPNLGLPRFASDASTALFDHLTAITDAIDALWGPWVAYTPVWSQSDGTVLSIGSGMLVGRYRKQGKTVFAQIRLERAADSNVGSGAWIFTLPPVDARAWNMVGGGFAMVRNLSHFGGAVFPTGVGAVGAIVGDLGRVSNTIPISTHAAGDWYSLQIVYEAA
jgi:hypothetical protein